MYEEWESRRPWVSIWLELWGAEFKHAGPPTLMREQRRCQRGQGVGQQYGRTFQS